MLSALSLLLLQLLFLISSCTNMGLLKQRSSKNTVGIGSKIKNIFFRKKTTSSKLETNKKTFLVSDKSSGRKVLLQSKENEDFSQMLARASKIISPLPLPDTTSTVKIGKVYFTPSEERAAGKFELLLLTKGTLRQRLLLLQSLAKKPEPEALPALLLVLQTESDPLAAYTLPALFGLNQVKALKAFKQALTDKRTLVRLMSLSLLIAKRDKAAAKYALVALQKDSQVTVRRTAALGLGMLRVVEARQALEKAMRHDFPEVRISAAWALVRIGQKSGINFLSALALADDPQLSFKAVQVLGLLPGRNIFLLLLRILGNRENNVWKSSYLVLRGYSRKILQDNLDIPDTYSSSSQITARQLRRLRRRAALLAIDCGLETSEQGWRQRFALLNESMASSETREKILLANVLNKEKALAGLEPLLRGLGAAENNVVRASVKALRTIAKSHNLLPCPQGDEQSSWRVWWLKLCRIREVCDSKSRKLVYVINSPDGINYFAAEGVAIVPDVIVSKVKSGKKGELKINVSYRNETYSLAKDL